VATGTRAGKRRWVGLLAVVAVAALWYFWSESPFRAAVRDIAAAQAAYHRQSGRYGSLDELTAVGLLPPGLGWCAETAPAADAPADRWWAAAGPSHPLTGRFYYADQSGAVYASWEPIAPRVDRAAGGVPAGLRLVERP
jgi:hypothetical protein